MITDENEGYMVYSGQAENVTESDIHANRGLQAVVYADNGAKVSVGKVVIQNCKIGVSNHYMFSTAATYSEEMQKKWLENEGYNSCYRIESARLFFKAISKVLKDRAEFLGFAPVVYYGKERGIDLHAREINFHPALFKPGDDFGDQNEIRAVWRPLDTREIEPEVIVVPGISKYCSRLSIPNF